jgi:hypothetical protein
MGNGSAIAPFTDLKTALENPQLRTGHAIYLRAGTHHLTSDITVTVPSVTVRSYPGESAIIDLQQTDLNLNATGITLSDITIISSDQNRDTDAEDFITGITAGAVNIYAPITLTNVRIAGIANVGWWSGSTGTWKGVLAQDNGWDAGDRGHGHALYMQNRAADGIKVLESCILVNGYGYSLHAYGSSSADLESFTLNHCIVMNERALIGGGSGASIDGVTIDDCVFYAPLQLGYSQNAAEHRTASLTGSVLRGLGIRLAWQDLTVGTCTVLAGDGDCLVMPTTANFSGLTIDNNVYISSNAAPFALDGEGRFTLAEWRTRTGLDANSRHYTTVAAAVSAGDLTVPVVRVFAVNEGRHKANIAIWNPNSDATVSVDLSALSLANGSYELRQVRDQTGDVRAVTYTGAAVAVSMSGTTAYPPGYPTPYHPEAVPTNALPVFGAFELWAV